MAYKKLKYWFNEETIRKIAEKVSNAGRIIPGYTFPEKQFIESVLQELEALELTARVSLIADQLYKTLPQEYPEAVSILMGIMGPENPEETGMFTQWYWLMPAAKFIETYGTEHWDESIAAIGEITKRNTGEFCIRPFIRQYPEKTLAQMVTWSMDDNFHLRRLASEGVRPRLPWATVLQEFIDDPKPIIPIIENLKDDPSRFVQKSVANTVNDIIKDNEDSGLSLLEEWAEGKEISNQRKWIIKHALRNLRKKKIPRAAAIMEQIGYHE